MLKKNVRSAVPPKRQPTEIEKKTAALKAEKEKIEKKCSDEFHALLKKYNCSVIPSVKAQGKHVEWGLHFVANT